MRKFFSVFLAFSLCLSLISCKSIDDSSSEPDSDAEITDTQNTQTELTSSESVMVISTTLATAPASSNENNSLSVTGQSSKPGTSAQTTAAVTTTTAPITKRVTITEGLSFIQTAKLLEQNGICTVQKLLDTINTYDYSYYPLIGALSGENRCFKLEGYLYPDTYEFYIDQAPEDVLGKLLRNSDSKITDEYKSRAAELGFTMDQIITLASIIEKESASHSVMKTVSSVFYNRLDAGQRLESDATINYIEWYVKDYITGDKNRFNSYYNTYKCSALPAGPICSPGKAAIEAALYPETTDYYFFVNDTAGNYYFANTYEEHEENLITAGVTVPAQ